MYRKILLVLISIVFSISSFAQESKTTFGFCIKPIFPNSFFRTGPINFSNNNIQYGIKQFSGFSGGGLIRRTINSRLTLETGLLFVKRNYKLSIQDSSFVGETDFKIVGYEIPISANIFIQLGKKLYMTTALGASIDIFPSDISTYNANDKYFLMYSARTHKVNTGVLANVGMEYRTKKSGILYFGFNYHRSFSSVYTTYIEYYPERNYAIPPTSKAKATLQGDYIAIDIRYYFHDDAKKKTKLQE